MFTTGFSMKPGACRGRRTARPQWMRRAGGRDWTARRRQLSSRTRTDYNRSCSPRRRPLATTTSATCSAWPASTKRYQPGDQRADRRVAGLAHLPAGLLRPALSGVQPQSRAITTCCSTSPTGRPRRASRGGAAARARHREPGLLRRRESRRATTAKASRTPATAWCSISWASRCRGGHDDAQVITAPLDLEACAPGATSFPRISMRMPSL